MPKFNKEDKTDHTSVAAVIRNNQGHYLMSFNTKHRMWTFPIGKCRPDETIRAGLDRELKEELGIKVLLACEVHKYDHVYDFTGKDVKVRTHIFTIDQYSGEIKNMEVAKCRGLGFLSRDQIEAMMMSCRIGDCVTEYFRFND